MVDTTLLEQTLNEAGKGCVYFWVHYSPLTDAITVIAQTKEWQEALSLTGELSFTDFVDTILQVKTHKSVKAGISFQGEVPNNCFISCVRHLDEQVEYDLFGMLGLKNSSKHGYEKQKFQSGGPGQYYSKEKGKLSSHGSLGKMRKYFDIGQPVGVCPACGQRGNSNLRYMVIHLNDQHKWSRNKIADWLESTDFDLTMQAQPAKEKT